MRKNFSLFSIFLVMAMMTGCGSLLKPRSLVGEEPPRGDIEDIVDGGMARVDDGGNSDGSSDGSSDGNEPECENDRDCEEGELCIYGVCQSGCEDDSDCSNGLHCDPQMGPNGVCVACVDASHCDENELCVDNECRFDCSENPNACGEDKVCDPVTNTCVECLQDQECELGNICEDNACVEGCRTDRDCPGDLMCLDGSCIEGCIADSDCPLETFCYENQCTPGCNDDDSRCPEGETCEGDICEFTCGSDDDCGEGKLCIDQECVLGCRDDDDCGWGTSCDTSVTPGVCRTGCWNGWCQGDQICNEDDLCVDCITNDDCDEGYSCSESYCLIDEPLELCEECRDSRDCGDIYGVPNLCIRYGGWWGGTNFCARSCQNDASCPNGYRCIQKESVDDAIGKQCVPYTSGGDAPEGNEAVEPYGEISCAAHNDYLEHKQCGRLEGGGGGGGGNNWVQCADGAICSGWGITSTLGDDPDFEDNYTCSIFCAEDSDCPGEDSFCEDIPTDDQGPRGSRCAPNQ